MENDPMLLNFEMTIPVPHYPGGEDGELTVTVEAEVLPIGGGELEVVLADVTAEDWDGRPHEVVLSPTQEDYAVQRALDLYHDA
jgi:hypothetical protein